MCSRNLYGSVGDWREDFRLQQKLFQYCMCNAQPIFLVIGCCLLIRCASGCGKAVVVASQRRPAEPQLLRPGDQDDLHAVSFKYMY